MMLPEHLKIGFEVVRVSLGTKDFELQGEYDVEHGTIILTQKATPRRHAAILLHEILHACWDQAELSDLGDDVREEQIINRLAPVLAAVLLDNPQLRACLEVSAQSANSTCWREHHVVLQTPPKPIAFAVEAAIRDEQARLERELNTTIYPQGNERRSEQPCENCGRLTDGGHCLLAICPMRYTYARDTRLK